MQNIYYEMLRQKDDGIRKFRHDIENHMLYIYNKSLQVNNTEVAEYVEKMNAMIKVNDNIYNVGDEAINIILNYYISQLDENTEIEIMGKLSENFCEEPIDTNMIIGNVIKNSVQELEKINTGIKILKVLIEEGKVFKRITVINTKINDIEKWDDDKQNHGYGREIVSHYVDKNNGDYQVENNDDNYQVIITMPKSGSGKTV